MVERKKAHESALPEDPPPGSDPDPSPRFPKPSNGKHEARPGTLADNVEVTPLDEDKNLEEGIQVEET